MRSNVPKNLAAGLSSNLINWLTKATVAVALLIMPLMVTPVLDFNSGSTAFAANGGGNNGGGQGGSNGQGGGNSPDKGDLYGDMVYVLRDVDGIPLVDIEGCLRPLGPGGVELPLNWWIDPEVPLICDDPEEILAALETSEESEEPEDCDVIAVCEDNMVEVELGRLSVLRSPAKVLDRQRDEAVRVIDKAESVALDEGGRIMYRTPTATSEWATFDSPLINLALMREFHHWGALLDGDGEIVFDPATMFGNDPDFPFDTYSYILASAFGLGAGDDKEGMGIDADVVVRVNQILGIADLDPAIETIEHLQLGNFIDYSGYAYRRWDTYPGCITWYRWDVVEGWYLYSDTIVHAVFGDEVDPGEFFNIEGYALSANDARRVLLFTHDISDDALQGRVDKVFEDSDQFCPWSPPNNNP
jgi:hypothetical protein